MSFVFTFLHLIFFPVGCALKENCQLCIESKKVSKLSYEEIVLGML